MLIIAILSLIVIVPLTKVILLVRMCGSVIVVGFLPLAVIVLLWMAVLQLLLYLFNLTTQYVFLARIQGFQRQCSIWLFV